MNWVDLIGKYFAEKWLSATIGMPPPQEHTGRDPSRQLRGIVREATERHIPAGYMDALNAAEESERTILERMAEAAAG